MRQAVKTLIREGKGAIEQKTPMLGLWQTIGENFYPERADFIYKRTDGEEFADHLYSSYPIIARRDLGNSLSSMLRRDNWFKIRTDQTEEDIPGLEWLDRATEVQRKIMYSRGSGFVRATKEGDHDFAAFGQCAVSLQLNHLRNGLLYQCWHLRDLAWNEGPGGEVESVYRQWKPTASQLMRIFPKTVDQKVVKKAQKNPNCTINCMHIVVPSEHFDGEDFNTPFVSIYVDTENDTELEVVGLGYQMYIIPRWQTVSGSPYAYSPATVAALPDARLIQAMTQTLLEAGEKFTNPPLLGVQEALRGELDLMAGGVTWVDREYDERLGEVLRPLSQDRGGMPLGMEMQAGVREMIAEAFYLNKLSLPVNPGDMTAYEVSERIKEFVRQTLPIFEPMEMEYNGRLCEATFDLLMSTGAFGSPQDIPEELRGADVQFKFSSPIQEAVDRDKGQKFLEMKGLLREAVEIDQMAVARIDIDGAFEDALNGVGVPAKWLNDDNETEEARNEIMAKQAAMMAMEQGMEQGVEAV